MIGTIVFAAAVAAAPPPATAEICTLLSSQIETALMNIATIDAEDVGDNSAPRAQVRASRQVAEYARIQANIALMGAQRCAPYPHAIDPLRYLSDALNCSSALANAPRGSALPDECKRGTWKPMPGS